MYMNLPSYIVEFELKPKQIIKWRVNTDENLEAFCRILRLNKISDYKVTLD